MSDFELLRIRCTNCGADFDEVSANQEVFKCTRLGCGATFRIANGRYFALVDSEKAEKISLYRQALKKALVSQLPEPIFEFSSSILGMLPDDFRANIAQRLAQAKATGGDSRSLRDYLLNYPKATHEEFLEIFPYLLKYAGYSDLRIVERILPAYVAEDESILAEQLQKRFTALEEANRAYADIHRDVFLCHSSTDSDIAEWLYDELENDGRKVWISSRNLSPNSMDYWADIEKAIRKCSVFVVIASKDAMMSHDVQREMAFADSIRKPKAEYKIDAYSHTEVFKDFFDGITWIDATKDKLSAAYALKKRIMLLIKGIPVSNNSAEVLLVNPSNNSTISFNNPRNERNELFSYLESILENIDYSTEENTIESKEWEELFVKEIKKAKLKYPSDQGFDKLSKLYMTRIDEKNELYSDSDPDDEFDPDESFEEKHTLLWIIVSIVFCSLIVYLLFKSLHVTEDETDNVSNDPVAYSVDLTPVNSDYVGTSVSPTTTPHASRKDTDTSFSSPAPKISYVWATNSGMYYHSLENCGGMTNASKMTLDSATSRGKVACPSCMGGTGIGGNDGTGATVSNTYYTTSGSRWYHTIANCQGMSGASVVTEAYAIAAGKTACPECIGYYGTEGGKWYHTIPNCQGLQNTVTKSEAEWKTKGKTACPECMGSKSGATLTSTMVYATSGGTYFHTKSTCSGMKNASNVTVAQAIAAKKKPCPDCVKPASIYVFATAGGQHYHTKNNCSGMKNAQYVTAAFAMQYGKTACPDCASVFSSSTPNDSSSFFTETTPIGQTWNSSMSEATLSQAIVTPAEVNATPAEHAETVTSPALTPIPKEELSEIVTTYGPRATAFSKTQFKTDRNKIAIGLTEFEVPTNYGGKVFSLTGWAYVEDEKFDGAKSNVYVIVLNSKNQVVFYDTAIVPGITGIVMESMGKNLDQCEFTAAIDVSCYPGDDYQIGAGVVYKVGSKEYRYASGFGDAYSFSVENGIITTVGCKEIS